MLRMGHCNFIATTQEIYDKNFVAEKGSGKNVAL